MARTCTVCIDPGVEDVNSRLQAGDSLREVARTFGIARATLTRHAGHIEVGHPVDTEPAPGSHLAAALDLIEQVRVAMGADYAAQDCAEAEHLRALAVLVDASPSNVAALRELRLTLAEFRKAAAPEREDEQNALNALIASMRGPDPDARRRVYEAALAAGATPEAAAAAADVA